MGKQVIEQLWALAVKYKRTSENFVFLEVLREEGINFLVGWLVERHSTFAGEYTQ